MGLAASQARLLSLTSRIHDVEFEAQQLHYAKLKLALLEDDVYKQYENMLDEERLTIPGANGARIPATFDNLCGYGSINNSLGTTSHYIFRDSRNGDRLIVPTDVYNGYLNYGGSDPYDFAMYMMGIKIGTDDDSESTLYQQTVKDMLNNTSNPALKELRDAIYKQIDGLYDAASSTDYGTASSKEQFREDIMGYLISNSPIESSEFKGDVSSEIKEIIDSIKDNFKTIEFNLYKKNGGAEQLFNSLYPEGDFDKNKFNYYVRWGQLIEIEGGIVAGTDKETGEEERWLEGCMSANHFDTEIETNAELLNQNLISGYITIEAVYDDRKGGVSELPTTPATDTIINMDKLQNIDSKDIEIALKKAEAEKDRKLKEISRIDKNYDLTLNRLETERTALTTEYDSVKKVISDNVERTFGIFS